MDMPLAAAPYRASGLVPWHETVMPVPSPQVRYEEVNGPSSVAVRGPSLTHLRHWGTRRLRVHCTPARTAVSDGASVFARSIKLTVRQGFESLCRDGERSRSCSKAVPAADIPTLLNHERLTSNRLPEATKAQ
jgi:hypothetical protein